jgi:hypothetical protein
MADQTFTSGQILTAAQMTTLQTNIGLCFVKSQTIGSAVSSVSVSDAFSTTYDNYVIAVNEYVCTGAQLTLALNGITTLYSYQLNYASYNSTPAAIGNTLQSVWAYTVGNTTTTKNSGLIEVQAPFLASPTRIRSAYADSGASGQLTGINNNATSATGFTLAASTGTITGGTIIVYGYRKA